MFTHVRTDKDVKKEIPLLKILKREIRHCYSDMNLGIQKGSGISKLKASYWMFRYLFGMLFKPLHSLETSSINVYVRGNISKVAFRKNQSDIYILREIFLYGIYDFPYEKLCQNISTIIDLGSNAGIAAAFFYSCFPRARLICVEPIEENVKMIWKNMEMQNARWEIEHAAISNKNEEVEFFASEWWSSGTAIQEIDKQRKSMKNRLEQKLSLPSFKIPGITVQKLIDKYHLTSIDILKIDIEGMEEKLILSADCQWLDKVRLIIIEIHDKYIEGNKIREALLKKGFVVQSHHGPCEVFWNKRGYNNAS
jgi:FkbM family methyltransferase